jgi:hypothetical protein
MPWLNAEYLWVAAGALVTLALGLALLYWIDQEWRALDEKRRAHHAPPAVPPDPQPKEPSSGNPPLPS